MKKRGRDCLEIRRLRRDRVRRHLVEPRRHQGIAIEILRSRAVDLEVAGDVEGIEVTEAEIITVLAKNGMLKVERRISRDSCMIRVIRISQMRNGERRWFLRNEPRANSSNRR